MKASSFTIGSNISCTGSGGGGSGTSTPTRPSCLQSEGEPPKGKEYIRGKAFECAPSTQNTNSPVLSDGLE